MGPCKSQPVPRAFSQPRQLWRPTHSRNSADSHRYEGTLDLWSWGSRAIGHGPTGKGTSLRQSVVCRYCQAGVLWSVPHRLYNAYRPGLYDGWQLLWTAGSGVEEKLECAYESYCFGLSTYCQGLLWTPFRCSVRERGTVSMGHRVLRGVFNPSNGYQYWR